MLSELFCRLKVMPASTRLERSVRTLDLLAVELLARHARRRRSAEQCAPRHPLALHVDLVQHHRCLGSRRRLGRSAVTLLRFCGKIPKAPTSSCRARRPAKLAG